MWSSKVKLQSLNFYLACLIVITFWSTINGQCNLCSSLTNLACVSKTEFQVCVNGTPTGSIASCAEGYVCSTFDASICHLNGSDVVIACSDCNVCDANGIFACTGTQSYALCLGGSTPTQLTGSCAPNHFCSIEYPQICVNISQGIAPTCGTAGSESTTTTTTITTITSTTTAPNISPIKYPQKYCCQLQRYGRYSVGRNKSSTCRQYVFCVVRGGVWSGGLYNCPGRTYFNSYSNLCEDAVPVNCF